MQPSPVPAPPGGPGWVHEVKWDGVRCLATVAPDGTVAMRSRRGRDLTGFDDVAAALGVLADPAGPLVVDGELVCLVEGRPDFGAVMRHVGRRRGPSAATLVAFDLPVIAGAPHPAGLDDRRADLVARADGRHRRLAVNGVHTDGAALFAATADARLEGVVSKRTASAYRPGRTRDWVKAKHTVDSAHVVVGFGRDGTVLVASPDDTGALRLDGAVAAGGRLGDLRAATNGRPGCPLALARPPGGVAWVAPELVVTVRSLASSDRLREGRVVAVGNRVAAV